MKFADLQIGASATSVDSVSDSMVLMFAELSGDVNPIHLDEDFASKSIFKKRIVHGMLVSSFISKVIANKLPGVGSIYLNQNLNFKAPVFIDDTITTMVEVIDLKVEKKIVFLKTYCVNQNGEIVIDGSAIVKHSN